MKARRRAALLPSVRKGARTGVREGFVTVHNIFLNICDTILFIFVYLYILYNYIFIYSVF